MEPQPMARGEKAANFSIGRVALVLIPLAVLVVVVIMAVAGQIRRESDLRGQEVILNWFNMTSPSPQRLDPRFVDANQDLVADAPTDAQRLVMPEELAFSFVAGSTNDDEQKAWQSFADYLSKQIEKPVRLVHFDSADDQLQALSDGKLQVTVCNTGTVPKAVARHGFVPVCSFGHDDGSCGTTMSIIVPATSPAKSLEALKGSMIAFTSSDSNSGCKAAMALLRDHGMLPLRDYLWKFSGSHDESIKGVANKEYPAASVASDLLERARATGLVDGQKLRTIYESERFPPATFGYAWNLSPEVVEKVRAALLAYQPAGTILESEFQNMGVTKLVPVSYKQDFALVRKIDDTFRKPSPPANQQPANGGQAPDSEQAPAREQMPASEEPAARE